jgi:hypothetical protein
MNWERKPRRSRVIELESNPLGSHTNRPKFDSFAAIAKHPSTIRTEPGFVSSNLSIEHNWRGERRKRPLGSYTVAGLRRKSWEFLRCLSFRHLDCKQPRRAMCQQQKVREGPVS